MNRKLKAIYVCSVCSTGYRPSHKQQMTCSYTCSAIRRTRMYPNHEAMVKANIANRAAFKAKRIAQLAHLTPLEAYNLGRKDAYSKHFQREVREERRRA